MNNQIRELSPTKPNSEPAKGAPGFVKTDLSDEEMSHVSGGKGGSLALACANGKHIAEAKIIM